MWATGLYKTNDNGPGPTHGLVAIAMVDHDDDLPTRRPNTRNTNPQSHCSGFAKTISPINTNESLSMTFMIDRGLIIGVVLHDIEHLIGSSAW